MNDVLKENFVRASIKSLASQDKVLKEIAAENGWSLERTLEHFNAKQTIEIAMYKRALMGRGTVIEDIQRWSAEIYMKVAPIIYHETKSDEEGE